MIAYNYINSESISKHHGKVKGISLLFDFHVLDDFPKMDEKANYAIYEVINAQISEENNQ
jgi:hypothetical protein